jgi:hypothetical protein
MPRLDVDIELLTTYCRASPVKSVVGKPLLFIDSSIGSYRLELMPKFNRV